MSCVKEPPKPNRFSVGYLTWVTNQLKGEKKEKPTDTLELKF